MYSGKFISAPTPGCIRAFKSTALKARRIVLHLQLSPSLRSSEAAILSRTVKTRIYITAFDRSGIVYLAVELRPSLQFSGRGKPRCSVTTTVPLSPSAWWSCASNRRDWASLWLSCRLCQSLQRRRNLFLQDEMRESTGSGREGWLQE